MSTVIIDLAPVTAALNQINSTLTQQNGLIEALNANLEAITVQLQGCNEALHGQWECCIKGSEQSDAFMAITMMNYQKMPDERWDMFEATKEDK